MNLGLIAAHKYLLHTIESYATYTSEKSYKNQENRFKMESIRLL